MRLIKADEVKKAFIGNRYGTKAIEYIIDNVPTVKAIPVEWIKKQKVDFQNEDYPFNYCRGFQDGFNDCIDYLIDEWKEENEQTN